jgi:Arc/MetJ-type ribon-helix-helix transcriptional regulator
MTTPIPTRFSDEEVAMLDELVGDGVALNRSAVVRHAVRRLADEERRRRIGEQIAASYREVPMDPELEQLAGADARQLLEEQW